jgi:hypothetical protein
MITGLIIGFIIYKFFRKEYSSKKKEMEIPVCDNSTNIK